MLGLRPLVSGSLVAIPSTAAAATPPNAKSALPEVKQRSRDPSGHLDRLKLNLLGQDKFFGAPGEPPRYDYPNPRAPQRASDLRSWVQFQIPPTPGGTPFAPRDLPNPRRARVLSDGWIASLPPGTLLKPFRPQDYPAPRRGKTNAQFWTVNLLESTLQPLPFTAVEWRIPSRQGKAAASWAINLLENTLATITPVPPAPATGPIRASVTATSARGRVVGSSILVSGSSAGVRSRSKATGIKAGTSASATRSKGSAE